MEKVKRFVDAHVIYCQSSLVDDLISKGMILNDCIYSDDGEVLEWWLLTLWLAERPQENDEIVIEEFACHWWGRQCSYQAIYLDQITHNICTFRD